MRGKEKLRSFCRILLRPRVGVATKHTVSVFLKVLEIDFNTARCRIYNAALVLEDAGQVHSSGYWKSIAAFVANRSLPPQGLRSFHR